VSIIVLLIKFIFVDAHSIFNFVSTPQIFFIDYSIFFQAEDEEHREKRSSSHSSEVSLKSKTLAQNQKITLSHAKTFM